MNLPANDNTRSFTENNRSFNDNTRSLNDNNRSFTENNRSFMVPMEIFDIPNLDIYTQMVCIVLRSYSSDAGVPTLTKIAQQGRMTPKQATRALQTLLDIKIISHKLFRQIIGDFSDDRLSWSAKGLLSYCNTNPNIRIHELLDLASQSSDDEARIRRALGELKKYGYLEEFPELKKVVN